MSVDVGAEPGVHDAPTFLDDARLIIGRNGDLSVVDLRSSSLSTVPVPSLDLGGPAVRDGTITAVGIDEQGRQDLFRVATDGTGLERLTDDEAFDSAPMPAPDGSLLFVSDRDGAFRLWHRDASGGTRLVSDTEVFGRPALSPGGDVVCVEMRDDGALSLGLIDIITGEVTPLDAAAPVTGDSPAFDADGRIYFRRFVTAEPVVAEIFVHDPGDGSTRQLTADGLVASFPALAP